MKLLAQFYAYLALILFIAVLSIDCRSSGARRRHGVEEESDVPKEMEEVQQHKMVRRHTLLKANDEPEPPKELDDEPEKHQMVRRHALRRSDDEPEVPKEMEEDGKRLRQRRQMPVPMPDEMGVPMPFPH